MSAVKVIKDIFKEAVEANGNFQLESFKMTENFDVALTGKDNYPFFHLELPLNSTVNNERENVKFSFAVLASLKNTNNKTWEDPIDVLDYCYDLAKSIVFWVEKNKITDIEIKEGWVILTITEYSDDDVHGVRVDMVVDIPKEMC